MLMPSPPASKRKYWSVSGTRNGEHVLGACQNQVQGKGRQKCWRQPGDHLLPLLEPPAPPPPW